ncbi:hypothetical protein CC78DRAFT_530886 [Lojkania enalia]|uniref:Uncharacterized protein n=1 Tax=Lojkania enalia TaxID=147567 RepID=A0A9P4N2H8_9PLEO|nr:hypothetical protein CC78DRAFT_530886 [Didymosphaeria enalia]
MAIQEGFVLVQLELFSRMRKHCENCHDFNIPLQDLSDGRVVTPTDLSSNSRKRKASQSIGSTQNASISISTLTPQSETEATEPQPRSQPSRTGPPLQSNSESLQSGSATSQSGSAPSELPTPSRPLSEPQKKKRVTKSRTTLALDRFVQNAPEGNRWRARQSELGLNTVEKYEDVIQGFSRRTYAVSKRKYCKELGELNGELIVVGQKLALLIKLSLKNVDLQKSFAYFHVLILL